MTSLVDVPDLRSRIGGDVASTRYRQGWLMGSAGAPLLVLLL